MRQLIGIMVIIVMVCCLGFCEEPTITTKPYSDQKAAVEKVVPKEEPKKKPKKYDGPTSMF